MNTQTIKGKKNIYNHIDDVFDKSKIIHKQQIKKASNIVKQIIRRKIIFHDFKTNESFIKKENNYRVLTIKFHIISFSSNNDFDHIQSAKLKECLEKSECKSYKKLFDEVENYINEKAIERNKCIRLSSTFKNNCDYLYIKIDKDSEI